MSEVHEDAGWTPCVINRLLIVTSFDSPGWTFPATTRLSAECPRIQRFEVLFCNRLSYGGRSMLKEPESSFSVITRVHYILYNTFLSSNSIFGIDELIIGSSQKNLYFIFTIDTLADANLLDHLINYHSLNFK